MNSTFISAWLIGIPPIHWVTCAIPATSKAAHKVENVGALFGRLPDAELRMRMAKDMQSL